MRHYGYSGAEQRNEGTEMRRLSNLLAWGALAIVAALVVLNWPTLMIPAPLNLGVAQFDAPLGVVMLAVAAVLLALFLLAYLLNQIGALLETRRLLREIQRVQDLADKAEASRIENLHQLIATEFRLLNERFSSIAAVAQRPDADPERKPLSLGDLMAPRQ